MIVKNKILIYWDYTRKDWLSIFKELSTVFDLTFVAEVFPENNVENVRLFANVIYYGDYNNSFELIDHIKPQAVVFTTIWGLRDIALNFAAQKKGICTFYLQHGLYGPIESYLGASRNSNVSGTTSKLITNKSLALFTVKFYLKTFKLNYRALVYLLNYIRNKDKMPTIEFLMAYKLKHRVANKYLVFTKSNANYLSRVEGFEQNKYIEIGDLQMDKFLAAKNDGDGEYILIIDSPLVEVNTGGNVVKKSYSAQEANQFYKLVNDYALSNGLPLKIKLHPYNYDSTFYLQHPNIEILRDCDVVHLISQAKEVVSFQSTLSLPVILQKPFLLIRTHKSQTLLNDLESAGIPEFPIMRGFRATDIKFHKVNMFPEVLKTLLEKYVYKSDGKAMDRLIKVLESSRSLADKCGF